ncbi:Serine--tRNA ligase, mitochondrial [Wickerhamiella sorbophila]|uniref:serine--tRNA ligase n=1 Tax=Wickerhamiella sorbophila TaxID=45607 RepID=A0A2T0FN34_9ASCO|nr:Serine--tRNA ligase, mitochondrial [Wickerhamiella sorbophila]PRT56401.1 Serine--tRNA ligase, mitochondrial [Wickerhamiella sorbophila]
MKVASSSNLKIAAWPLKRILANPAAFQKSVDLRQCKLYKSYSIADLVELHDQLQAAKHTRQLAATERNRLLKQVKGSISTKDSLQGELLTQSKALKEKMAVVDEQVSALESEFNLLLDTVPNLIEPSAARIDGEFEQLKILNERPISADQSRDHVTIGSKLGLLDIASASRVSGHGSYYLTGDGALLEQALVQYALKKCRDAGFTMVSPPSLVRQEFTNACGFKPRDSNNEVQVYSVYGGGGPNADPMCLAGTAEIPLAGLEAHKTIDFRGLTTLRKAGVSRSFRAEAGARGADTRGLYRVHEFTKVEMFVWCRPDIEASQEAIQNLLSIQQSIVNDLELTARVINIGPTDLGAPAYQKYDIEAWMPGRGSWGEISSTSNCLDFQSRRLHTKDTNGEFVHTLNGTALAVPRVIVALIENGWDGKGVRVPKALHNWMPEYISL